MNRARLEPGTDLLIDERRVLIKRKLTDGTWQFEDQRNGRIFELTEVDIHAKLQSRRIVIISERNPRIERAPTFDPSDPEFDEAKRRLAYVKELEGAPNTRALIGDAIRVVHERIGGKRPGVTSVYEWKKRYSRSEDIRALVADHAGKGNHKPRFPKKVEEIARRSLDAIYLTLERRPLQAALNHAVVAIDQENRLRLLSDQLPRPTITLLRRLLSDIPSADVTLARYGRDAKRHEYRSVKSHDISTAPLQFAEADNTVLDVIVVDPESNIRLGRPNMCCIIDVFTRCILNIYIGFDEFSFQTAAKCLKGSFWPKSDLQEKMPSLTRPWEAHGMPQVLKIDNGKDFQPLEWPCLTFGIDLRVAPRKEPWFKPHIERFINTFNLQLCHGLPGSTSSNPKARGDYDSVEEAVLTLPVLREIVTKWIVEVYHDRPHRGLDGKTPAQMWKEHVCLEDIPYPTSTDELDAVMRERDQRILHHHGISYHNLSYNSPELQALRMSLGSKLRVEIRIDKSDIGSIQVIHPISKIPLEVSCLSREVWGKSLWQHDLIKRHAADAVEKPQTADYLQAEADIERLVAEARSSSKSRVVKKLGRYTEAKDRKPKHRSPPNLGHLPVLEEPTAESPQPRQRLRFAASYVEEITDES